jgi:V/A-type H+-transporting ATPase subunit D
MARLNVNPTRMEKQKQSGRAKTAKRGHKLLKDKSDEMIRHFLKLIKENRELREQVEGELSQALRLFMVARTQMSAQEIEAAVVASATTQKFTSSTANIMGLVVPKIMLAPASEKSTSQNISIATNTNFDKSVKLLSTLLQKLIELANVEKTCDMLAAEIERNRRRINALEHIMIPQIQETIKYITMKLSENERGNQVRLMKVKAMLDENE